MNGIQDQVTKNEVAKQLRVALAGEFNASHNLGMQAQMIEGYHKEEIKKQLWEMHEREMEHSKLLINRLMEMGGNPDIRPIAWDNTAACDYYPITQTDQKDILENVYSSKSCKAQYYTKLLQFLETKDKTTYDLVNRIMEQEYAGLDSIRKMQEELLSADERQE